MQKINLDPIDFSYYFKKLKVLLRKYFIYLFFIILGAIFLFLSITLLPSKTIYNAIIYGNPKLTSCVMVDDNDNALWLYNLMNHERLRVSNTKDKEILVPAIFISNLPKNLSSLEEKKRVDLFIKTFLPIIAKIEKDIQKDIARITEINETILSAPITSKNLAWLKKKASEYDETFVGETVFDYFNLSKNLLIKIGTVPASVIIGIAGTTTYWGNRPMLLDGNKFFGSLKDLNPNDTVVNAKSMSTRFQSFSSIENSIKALYTALNSYDIFNEFRLVRQQNPSVNPEMIRSLAPLILYKDSFSKDLEDNIKNHKLVDYDKPLKLVQPNACLKF